MRYTIWTNELNYEDWKDDLEDYYPDEKGYTNEDRYRLMYEINDDYLDDERINLDKPLDNYVIAFGDLGLWFGRRIGYKKLGLNLNSIFYGTCGDYVTWYVEDDEIKCKDVHHDGTNLYTYRVLKKNVDMYEFEEFAYDHSAEETVEKYTEPLGHYVAEIYGFNISK